jgi:hypothetical protein
MQNYKIRTESDVNSMDSCEVLVPGSISSVLCSKLEYCLMCCIHTVKTQLLYLMLFTYLLVFATCFGLC